jgi:hypothetical protein
MLLAVITGENSAGGFCHAERGSIDFTSPSKEKSKLQADLSWSQMYCIVGGSNVLSFSRTNDCTQLLYHKNHLDTLQESSNLP